MPTRLFPIFSATLVLIATACQERSSPNNSPGTNTDLGLVPTEGYVATEDGSRIYYRIVGRGEQVVMIPMAVYLADELGPLAEKRRLLFYDPRGRGRSDPVDPSTVSEDREIRDMERLRESLGIDSMALLGWSGLGKQVAVYATRHPDRVTTIVQVAPVPPSSGTYPQEEGVRPRSERVDREALQALDVQRAAGDFAADSQAYCREHNRLTNPASFANPTLARLVPDVCVHRNEWPENLGPYFDKLLGSQGIYDWRDSIRATRIPRLVIHGREDGIPVSGARAWVRDDPNARLLILSPAGHFPFLELPEEFFSAVDRFLEGQWPSEARQIH